MTTLWDTTGTAVVKALSAERRKAGSVSSGLALTLVVVVEEGRVDEAEQAATRAAAEHPCRLIIVVRRRPGAPEARLDAEVLIGGRLGPGEAAVLRMYGRLALHAESVVLPLLAPVIDVATVYSVLVSPTAELLYVWLGFLALQLLTAGYAFRLDGERLRPLWALPLQQLVYRQLMYLVVLQSVASACYGLRQRWQAMKRTGELDQEAVAAVSV